MILKNLDDWIGDGPDAHEQSALDRWTNEGGREAAGDRDVPAGSREIVKAADLPRNGGAVDPNS